MLHGAGSPSPHSPHPYFRIILFRSLLVRITSLAAALAKLNVKIEIEDLIKAIHDEDEAERVRVIAEANQRRAALSELGLQPNKATTAGLTITTVSKFVAKPAKPAHVDPLAKERRRRLIELHKQAFPDGRVPDPFTLL